MEKDLNIYIGNRIRYYRQLKKMTQDELAFKLGLGKGTISNYESGYRTPQQDRLFELSEALGISINNLFPPTTDQSNIEDLYNKLDESRQTKVYNFAKYQLDEQNRVQIHNKNIQLQSKLSAGTGIIDLDPEHTEEVTVEGFVPEHDLAFQVSGDSMIPMFEDGEIIYVEKTEEVRTGQVIAIQINEEAFIKKLYIEDDRLRLVSLNKDYKDIIADEHDDIRIVGRVIL